MRATRCAGVVSAWNIFPTIDVAQDPRIVAGNDRDLSNVALEQCACAFVALEFEQFLFMAAAEPDRMSAFPVVFRNGDAGALCDFPGDRRYGRGRQIRHVSERDDPAIRIYRGANAANQAARHAQMGIIADMDGNALVLHEFTQFVVVRANHNQHVRQRRLQVAQRHDAKRDAIGKGVQQLAAAEAAAAAGGKKDSGDSQWR
jgi:hypothetical protein